MAIPFYPVLFSGLKISYPDGRTILMTCHIPEGFINEKGRPNHGLQKAEYTHPESGGNGYEIYSSANETQSINSA
jgi:hypothetical protein